jgi:hypothetical protein
MLKLYIYIIKEINMSMKIPSKRNVLYFKNSYISDYSIYDKAQEVLPIIIENDSSKNMCHTSNDSPKKNIKWDKIIPEFRTINEWPNRTNILCSICSLSIEQSPIPLPNYIVNDETSGLMIFKGIKYYHCSWTCASKRNRVYNNNDNVAYFSLKCLYKLWNNNVQLCDIPEGLNHTEMLSYGGSHTQLEWNNKNTKILRNAISRLRTN